MTPIDRLIDDVAQAMTAERPSPTLHARTMNAIAARRGRSSWWLRIAIPACAIVMLAGVPLLHSRLNVTLPDVPQRATAAVIAGALAVPAQAASTALPAPTARPGSKGSAMTIAQREWNARRIASLPAPAAIETADIQPEQLQVPLLQLKPLVTEPLTIEPIHGGR